MTSEKHDWLGICLEMMSEYLPIEVCSKSGADKYWSITPHLLSIMEFSEIRRRRDDNEELNRRNDVVKDMIRLFAATTMTSMSNSEGDSEADSISDNVALNNLLLLSLLE
jgi:hypothetical protein